MYNKITRILNTYDYNNNSYYWNPADSQLHSWKGLFYEPNWTMWIAYNYSKEPKIKLSDKLFHVVSLVCTVCMWLWRRVCKTNIYRPISCRVLLRWNFATAPPPPPDNRVHLDENIFIISLWIYRNIYEHKTVGLK